MTIFIRFDGTFWSVTKECERLSPLSSLNLCSRAPHDEGYGWFFQFDNEFSVVKFLSVKEAIEAIEPLERGYPIKNLWPRPEMRLQ